MPYEVMDHTADTGIRVWAPTLAALFEEAARAMFELIADPDRVSAAQARIVRVDGLDRTDLLINWMRELLWLWAAKQYLVKEARVAEIDETRLAAEILGEPLDPEKHEILTDIKAVTYHGARVEPSAGGWEAAVIFDI